MKTNMKKFTLAKGALLSFMCAALFSFASCQNASDAGADFAASKRTGSITFTIDSTLAQILRGAAAKEDVSASRAFTEEEAEGLWLEISLSGDVSDTKTIPVAEGRSASFPGIQVGLSVWAEASAYKIQDGQKVVLYYGKSDIITVAAGVNPIDLTLKAGPKPGDSGGSGGGTGDDPNKYSVQVNDNWRLYYEYEESDAITVKSSTANSISFTANRDINSDIDEKMAQVIFEGPFKPGKAYDFSCKVKAPEESLSLSYWFLGDQKGDAYNWKTIPGSTFTEESFTMDCRGVDSDAIVLFFPSTAGDYEIYDVSVVESTLYTISPARVFHDGTYSAPTISPAGNDVLVEIKPAEGYELDQLTVTAADGSNVPVSKVRVSTADGVVEKENLWEFIMPAQNVTMDVTFKLISSGGGSGGGADSVTLATPLTLEAIEAGAVVTFTNKASGAVTYKMNGGAAQTIASGETAPITLGAVGDKVSFYGDNAAYATDFMTKSCISCDKGCYVYGNIMSLITSSGFESAVELTGAKTFYYLFNDLSNLSNGAHIKNKDGCGLFLPATTLTESCYNSMFSNCSSLAKAPELPATELAESCYVNMFNGCTSLTRAPDLPATTLAKECCNGMFSGCSKLSRAPELPATTLAEGCYKLMFTGCSSLTRAPELPAETLVKDCYNKMFLSCSSLSSVTCLATDISAQDCASNWLSGVASTGTFKKAADMTDWTVGASGIPSGWTDLVYSGGVTITVDTGASDIEVSISVSNSGAATETYDGSSPIDIGTNANQIVFAAQEGFASYVWKIDNKTVDSSALTTSWKLSLDNISLRTVWPVGVYDIELEAFDAAGTAYSFSAQISITD